MSNTKWYGKNRGIYGESGAGAISFEIVASTDQASIDEDKASFQNLIKYSDSFAMDGFTVATNGESNNLPGEVRDFIKLNSFLPEVLKKQTRIMIGQGPMLYNTDYDDDNRKIRKPVDENYKEVLEWMNSWQKLGLPPLRDYIHQTTQNYYYAEEYYSGWHFNKSRRINAELPIRGLEALSPVKCRKAMKGSLTPNEKVEDRNLNHIMIGEWDKLFKKEFKVYHRLNPVEPLKYPYAINYTADFGFDEDIYSTPTFFFGLKEWIRGSNLNPKYINSYLKNSLNAKLHVIIPDAWITQKENELKSIVQQNQENTQKEDAQVTEYDGLTGISITFSYAMVQKLIDKKLQEVANVLSGSGENQGKTFWSRGFAGPKGTEEWQFKKIPVEYKEFIDSILSFDKRATSMILTGKGLDPSISNISNDGIYGGSGSQSYYNYLIYLESLPFAEQIICEELNMAARINFPQLEKNDVTIGFYRHIPQRIEETPPSNRIESQKK